MILLLEMIVFVIITEIETDFTITDDSFCFYN